MSAIFSANFLRSSKRLAGVRSVQSAVNAAAATSIGASHDNANTSNLITMALMGVAAAGGAAAAMNTREKADCNAIAAVVGKEDFNAR